MTESQREQVRDIFSAIAPLPAAERTAALHDIADPDVRAEVESLLEFAGPETTGIHTPIEKIMREASESGAFGDRLVGPGTRFERYRIERKIGHGGMGDVYEAVRENDFHKRVALKIVRFGLDSEFARVRFQQERQTLAGLEHPFIARLLDGGESSNGCPYLVLEFVDGVPIDLYCEGRPREEILKLFLKVCEAVEYAHRNLVIHRDLKPANILVTADGDPKLLDFGIAKLLDPTANVLQTMVAAMTPQYASPEQIRGEAITTASDAYSLGVILYQLLTSRRPYQIETANPSELERVVCQEPPAPPGLGDELDDILMMALRKEPERRYANVLEFARDIQRYMNGAAVKAAPDSAMYRARKYVRRHWVGLLATSVAMLALFVGTGVATYQAYIAQQRFNDVRSLATTFLFDVHDKIAPLPGSAEAREMVVKTGLKYLDKLSQSAGKDASLLAELQAAYVRTGDAQGNPTGQSLGETDAAMQSYQRSIEIGERLRSGRQADDRVLETLCTAYYRVASIELDAGRSKESAATMQKCLAISELRQGHDPRAYFQTVRCYLGLAHAQRNQGEPRAAIESTQKALAAEIAGDKAHPNDQTQRALVVIRTQLGNDMVARGDLNGALQQFQLASQIGSPLLSKEHELKSYDRFQRSLAYAYAGAGAVSGDPFEPNLGDAAASNRYNRQLISLLEAVQRNEPKDLTTQRSLVQAYGDSAATIALSNQAAAIAMHSKAVAMAQRIVADDPKDAAKKIELAAALYGLGRTLMEAGMRADATSILQKSLVVQRSLPATGAGSADLKRLLASTLSATGKLEELNEGTAIAESLWKEHPQDLRSLLALADNYEAQGRVAAAAKDCTAARSWYGRSRDLWRSWPQLGVTSVFDTSRAARAERLMPHCSA